MRIQLHVEFRRYLFPIPGPHILTVQGLKDHQENESRNKEYFEDEFYGWHERGHLFFFCVPIYFLGEMASGCSQNHSSPSSNC
jgi:hypothetical protein